jgi:hyperosmotically inducible protein
MLRTLFIFMCGMVAGIAGYWFLSQPANEARLAGAREKVTTETGRAATNLKTRWTEISESSTEAIKEELNRTGMVIREKAKAAGHAIADTAANARVTASVKARLLREPGIPALSINVDSTDGLVTLSGKVKSDEQVAKSVQLALGTEGVHKVISTLQVSK